MDGKRLTSVEEAVVVDIVPGVAAAIRGAAQRLAQGDSFAVEAMERYYWIRYFDTLP
jgi:spermidine synthase